MYWSADKQKFARENIVLRKLKNIEAIWQGIKKKGISWRPHFMKTHKLLEHPLFTHTKFDKRILLSQCWRQAWLSPKRILEKCTVFTGSEHTML